MLPESIAAHVTFRPATKQAEDLPRTVFSGLWPKTFAKQPPRGGSIQTNPPSPGRTTMPAPAGIKGAPHDWLLGENAVKFYGDIRRRRLAAGKPMFPNNMEAANRHSLVLDQSYRGLLPGGRVIPSTVATNNNRWDTPGGLGSEPQGTSYQTVDSRGDQLTRINSRLGGGLAATAVADLDSPVRRQLARAQQFEQLQQRKIQDILQQIKQTQQLKQLLPQSPRPSYLY